MLSRRSTVLSFKISSHVIPVRRFLPPSWIRLPGMVVVAGLLAPACTPSTSSDAPSDSTATPRATTVANPSAKPGASPSTTSDDDRSLSQKLTDASVETRVKQALVETSSLRLLTVDPTVNEGHLTLGGDVNTTEQYREAERIARNVEGVAAVTNELTMGGEPVTEEKLASESSSSGEETTVYHTVRQGDTLWEIAREYRASVQRIRQLNELHSSSLDPGQRIRVR